MSTSRQRQRYMRILSEEEGNLSRAARRLGISRATLRRWHKRQFTFWQCNEGKWGCGAQFRDKRDAVLHALGGHDIVKRTSEKPISGWADRLPREQPARTDRALLDLIDHDRANPRLPGRLHHEHLVSKGHSPSLRTTARMLAGIRRRCPACKGSGKHMEPGCQWETGMRRARLKVETAD